MLSVSIQRDGEVDLLLRSIEDEMARRDVHAREQDMLFVINYLGLMSTYWIGSVYETFRLLKERNLADQDVTFMEIFRALELLRIPLEKHEIAKDRLLKEPLMFVRNPPQNDPRDAYTYDRDDTKRAHIMQQGLMPSGSMAWLALDLKGNAQRWVERRWISEKIIELWGVP